MKALIIDDEPMPAKNLAQLVDLHCQEITSVKILLSASKALDLVKEEKFDLIFLDIEMPEMTGFDFLELANLSDKTKVIITTAYKQYAIEAFDANATHYLVKPVKEKDLLKAIQRVNEEQKNSKFPSKEGYGVLSISDGKEHHIIQEEDILRLEADGSYTMFVLKGRTLVSSKNIGTYESKLSKSLFFRPHKSHIINLKYVVKLNKGRGGYIVLSNKELIPLTESKQEAFEKAIGI